MAMWMLFVKKHCYKCRKAKHCSWVGGREEGTQEVGHVLLTLTPRDKCETLA